MTRSFVWHETEASSSGESFPWYWGPPSIGTIARADRTGLDDYGAVMSDRPVPADAARPSQARPDARPDVRPRARRRLSLIVASALFASSVGLLATPAVTLGWSANAFNSASEQQLMALTNQARSSAGRAILRWDSALGSIARWRSKDMIKRDYFSHSIPGGGNVFDEMSARGYCYKVAGENIGWNNYPDDAATAQIQQMFMGSSGHRSNILGKDWDRIGIGAYKGADGKKMWTVLFADKCGGSSGGSGGGTSKPKPKPNPVARATPKPTPKPTAKPTAEPTATPIPTAEPTDPLAPRDAAAGDGIAGLAPGGSGPVAQGQSLRVVDRRPQSGLLESIFGGLAGMFGG